MNTKLNENSRPLFVSWRIDPITPKKQRKVCSDVSEFVVNEYYHMHLWDLKMIIDSMEAFFTTGNKQLQQTSLENAKKIKSLIERMGRNEDYRNHFYNLKP